MDQIKKSKEGKQASETRIVQKDTTYELNGKRFVVSSVFPENGRETFGSILLRLMKSEINV